MDSGFCFVWMFLLVHSENFLRKLPLTWHQHSTLISESQTNARLCRPGTSSLSEKLSHRPPVLSSVFCWSRALRQCLWSCVLWSVWSRTRPWGLVKSLTTGLLSHTALPPQYQNSHICRAAACRSSRFMSWTQRDTGKTGGPALDLFSGSKQLFLVLW